MRFGIFKEQQQIIQDINREEILTDDPGLENIPLDLDPARKNLGELISLSAALLISGQFWYLDKGGAHVVLYLPLILLMMYRPNLSAKTAYTPEVKPTYRL